MSPVNLQHRAIQWQRLNSILNSYETLYNTEQAFLMEVGVYIQYLVSYLQTWGQLQCNVIISFALILLALL